MVTKTRQNRSKIKKYYLQGGVPQCVLSLKVQTKKEQEISRYTSKLFVLVTSSLFFFYLFYDMLSLLLLMSDDFVCSLENEGKEFGEWRESEVEVQSESVRINDNDWWWTISQWLGIWLNLIFSECESPSVNCDWSLFVWLSDDWRVYVKWFMIPEFEGEGLVTYEFSL